MIDSFEASSYVPTHKPFSIRTAPVNTLDQPLSNSILD